MSWALFSCLLVSFFDFIFGSILRRIMATAIGTGDGSGTGEKRKGEECHAILLPYLQGFCVTLLKGVFFSFVCHLVFGI